MVWALKAHERKTPDICDTRKLGDSLLRVLFQVPANRLGHQIYTLPQLKIMQEVITMCVFAAFTFFVMKKNSLQLSLGFALAW